MACDLDMARCRSCYCQGRIMRDYWGSYVEWPGDMCAKCYRDLDDRMEKLAASIEMALGGTVTILEASHGSVD